MNICDLKRLSNYTQNMNIVKLLIDKSDSMVDTVIFLFKKFKLYKNQEEQEELVSFYINNYNTENNEKLLKLLWDEKLLCSNINDHKKILDYYKNNNYSGKIATLILMFVRFFNINDIFVLLCIYNDIYNNDINANNYNDYQKSEVYRLLKNEKILEHRNCTEIITLITQLKNKKYDITTYRLICDGGLLINYSCSDQIKIINKIFDIDTSIDKNLKDNVIKNILHSKKIRDNFSVSEIIILIDKYSKTNDKTILDIITDSDIIKYRKFSEIIILIDLYVSNPKDSIKALIETSEILENLDLNNQMKLIKLYLENQDIKGLINVILDSESLNKLTINGYFDLKGLMNVILDLESLNKLIINEYFDKIYDYILRYRNTYSAEEAITKFDNIDDFIKCLESDNVKEINSSSKIYCYIPKEDKK